MQKPKQPTIISYVTGFILSLGLTCAAYELVKVHVDSVHEIISHTVLLPAILILAFVQFIIQLIFFLHIGNERGPRWNLAIFFSTISIIFIIVVGSLWIMNHLNYNMTSDQVYQYLQYESTF